MSIYLSYLNKPQFTQQLTQNPTYMAKHKISINKPTQTHFTVQGVQAYSPEQIKALKVREDRVSNQAKQGSFVAPRVVLLSDQIIQFDEADPLQKEKNKSEQVAKQVPRPKTQSGVKKQRVKTNARNAASANTQAVVKLQKQVAKRNSLQRKLQKMSSKYKQFFKDVDLKQKKNRQQNQKNQEQCASQQEEQPQIVAQQKQDNQQQLSINKQSQKYDQTTHYKSQKKNKKGSKKKEGLIKQNQSQYEQSEADRSIDFLGLGVDLVGRCSTYSEKLGTAIHQMFK